MQEMFLTNGDAAACFGSLSKLARHLEKPVIITGSIATGKHLLKKGGWRERKSLNDIDTVVEDLASVRDSISKDFLINHFHPFRGKGRVLLQLVDAEHGTRIEIFTSNSKTLSERLSDFEIGDLFCQAVSAEDVLAKLLSIVYSITKGEIIDPKYVGHFRILLDLANLKTAKKIWQDYRKEDQPPDFSEAVKIVERAIAANPHLLRAEEYCRDINFECRWCVESEAFPLAPRTKIYEILGYV